jgi:hypothetical protein
MEAKMSSTGALKNLPNLYGCAGDVALAG